MAAGKFLLGLLLWQQVSFCWSYFYGSRQVFVGVTFMAAGMLGIGHYGGGSYTQPDLKPNPKPNPNPQYPNPNPEPQPAVASMVM